MNIKLLLARMGFPAKGGVKGYAKHESPLTRERQQFTEEVKEQFLKLKEKGLSIPVFTL